MRVVPSDNNEICSRMHKDRALLHLGGEIFKNPQTLSQAHWHKSNPKIHGKPHSHPDLLQLDLNVGISGTIAVERKRIRIHGVSVAAFYPGECHSFDLNSETEHSEIFSIKIRVKPSWPAIRLCIFPRFMQLTVADHYLVRTLKHLSRVSSVASTNYAITCATLTDVLCHWPLDHEVQDGKLTQHILDDTQGRGMHNALELIDQRLQNPPALGELAKSAHLSTRSLVRRFHNLFGCTPHAYISARRLSRARELLAHSNHTVTEIADELGFSSIHTFSRWFNRLSGNSPSVFRDEHTLL